MLIRRMILGVTLTMVCAGNSFAQSRARAHARLIWQDSAEQTLRWGDIKKGEAWSLEPQSVSGSPELDSERHMFVQMQSLGSLAVVGVRDDDDGAFKSGWFAFDSGVEQEAHGDHYHWQYHAAPKVTATTLDTEQGNPAHVYLYDDGVYIANDKKNGFTFLTSNSLEKGGPTGKFFEGGGGHITLAAIKGQVAYSTWIDRAGDNVGRVDVIGLGSNEGRAYNFQLPSGGIHGATANSGKVFFAPTDGVCWVSADMDLTGNEGSVSVQHMSLGENEDGTPKRTGAFTNVGSSVLFTIGGRSGAPELCVVNAASPKPSVSKLNLPVAEGHTLSTPTAIQSRTGGRFALLFEESPGSGDDELLHIVALDPNRDGSFGDAELKASIPVGRSLIEGHSGHHSALPLSKQFVALSNPGDGTISILSTTSWKIESTLEVGGTPTRMIAFGGK